MPDSLTVADRLRPPFAALQRWLIARSRPSGRENARRLRERGESLDTITFRDATLDDVPALAELHVTTWNATYRTSRGPSVATRAAQWQQKLSRDDRRDFLLVLEDANARLIGFTWGLPSEGEWQDRFAGELSKIFLRWEYHGLGLGRRMMALSAERFLARDMRSFLLFAELTNPTIGFYDHMGGERLRDARGQFHGAYGWRDARTLLQHSR